jgi:hypothetical protein
MPLHEVASEFMVNRQYEKIVSTVQTTEFSVTRLRTDRNEFAFFQEPSKPLQSIEHDVIYDPSLWKWLGFSMLAIDFKDGAVIVKTDKEEYRITEIGQLYLVQHKLDCYRKGCTDEQTHRMFTAALDLLLSAKDKFLQYHEARHNVQEIGCSSLDPG